MSLRLMLGPVETPAVSSELIFKRYFLHAWIKLELSFSALCVLRYSVSYRSCCKGALKKFDPVSCLDAH